MAAAGLIAFCSLAACSDDDPASPPSDTTPSDGSTALPGDLPSVQNDNVGNPASPQDPVGSGP